MKKLTSLLLALIMVVSLSTVAFAAETNNGIGDYSAEVTGSYVAGTTSSGTIFSVDIDWTDMSFTYHAEKAPVWDPEEHKYSETAKAYWEGEGTVTVTNHSNAKISATPKYTAGEGFSDATMNFSPSVLNVASAESGSEQIGTITVTPDGFLPKMDSAKTIGSITVTIAQDNNATKEDCEKLRNKLVALQEEWKDNSDISADIEAAIATVDATWAMIESGNYDQQVVNGWYWDCLAQFESIKEDINKLS